ncbi:hypothetical protein QFC24_002663 [Naganishia onofrii]|uniref:Uncharacterized protein n=1 Tax=Naganishia onofrii TaxID=1851511 RepID=A0ACC2XRB4_9TREE|nr:hypothetical protein QFC24_002663 [Naganishia onofrii]
MSLGKKNPVVLLTVRPSPPFPSDLCTNPFWYSGARPALQNDDGPPSPSSPNIYSFALALRNKLNWDVRVVIPDCQKSWVGSAYAISDVVQAMFFYPRGPDGLTGDIEYKRRPLNKEQGEEMEWVLLTGTPATCANIALHNIYEGEIDLVVSGPNHGRNSSSAFAISSGTIGATLSSTFSSYPSIALSYGVVTRPVPPHIIHLANDAAVDVCARLWADWGTDTHAQRVLDKGKMGGKVQLYAVNLLLVEEFLKEENRKVMWTRIARNGYGQLFKRKQPDLGDNPWQQAAAPRTNAPQTAQPNNSNPASAGPAVAAPSTSTSTTEDPSSSSSAQQKDSKDQDDEERIVFHFAPDMKPLILPEAETLLEGSDSWALHHGFISVTPLQASFAEPEEEAMRFGSEVSAGPANGQGEGTVKGQWKM